MSGKVGGKIIFSRSGNCQEILESVGEFLARLYEVQGELL